MSTFFFKKPCTFRLLLLVAMLFIFQSCTSPKTPSRPNGLEVGDQLVDFSLMDENGQFFKLSELRPNWYLVVVLYRGDYCDSCRTMLFNLKDNYSHFALENVAVAAISTDSVDESFHFNDQWRFPFPLLSDPTLRLIDAFGARHPKGHGIYDIAHPTVVILDPQKTIRYKKTEENPEELPNPNEILSLVRRFKGQETAAPLPPSK